MVNSHFTLPEFSQKSCILGNQIPKEQFFYTPQFCSPQTTTDFTGTTSVLNLILFMFSFVVVVLVFFFFTLYRVHLQQIVDKGIFLCHFFFKVRIFYSSSLFPIERVFFVVVEMLGTSL